MDVAQPDEKSVMTYVAQFLHKYPDSAAQSRDATMTTSIDPELTKMNEFLAQAENTLNRQDPDLDEQVRVRRHNKASEMMVIL